MRKTFAFTLILIMLSACGSLPSSAKKSQGLSPPRSLHTQLKSSEINTTFKLTVISEVSSWDQSGHLRLQLRLQSPTKTATQLELRQALYQSLVPYLQKYSVIWTEVIPSSNSSAWLARADWFAAAVPIHQRFSVSRPQETFRGLKIEYFK